MTTSVDLVTEWLYYKSDIIARGKNFYFTTFLFALDQTSFDKGSFINSCILLSLTGTVL